MGFQSRKWHIFLEGESATLNCLKAVHFLQFCANRNDKSDSIKAIYIMHLKDLITYFQKMVPFIMLWLTVSEILKFELDEFHYISADSASFLVF